LSLLPKGVVINYPIIKQCVFFVIMIKAVIKNKTGGIKWIVN